MKQRTDHRNAALSPLFFLILGLSVGFIAPSCKRKLLLDKEIQTRYNADANAYCNAVVNCLKQEISEKLADEPERRDMVLARMKRDLCVEKQFHLIGDLTTEPYKGKPVLDEKLYNTYSLCTKAIVNAPNCIEMKRIHQEEENCKALRQDFGSL